MKRNIFIFLFILIFMEANAMFSGIIFWDEFIKDSDIDKLNKNDISQYLKNRKNIIYTIEVSKILWYFYDSHCIEVDISPVDLKINMNNCNNLLFSFVIDDMIVFSGINRIGRPPLASKNMYDEKFIKLFDITSTNKYCCLIFSNTPYSILHRIENELHANDDSKFQKEFITLYNFFLEKKKLRTKL